MKTKVLDTRLLCCLSLLLLVPLAAQAARDAGQASLHPWSGYWWPHKSGGLTEPLSKYDQLLGTQAAQWEDQNHVSTNPPPQGWFGHCHAWSAASVSEKEPAGDRQVEQVAFAVGDLKGLLTACHAADVANSYGTRCNGNDEAAFADLAPDELWRLLQTYVGQRKIPLILDLEAGEQVWNYPAYEYQVDYELGADGWCDASLQLVTANNNVEPSYVGTKAALHTYTFRVKMEDGAIVMGSGQWTGDSVQDHPDFAWYPYVAVAENPYVDVEQVAKIVGSAIGGGNAPDETADTNQPPTVETVPGGEDPPTVETVTIAEQPPADAVTPEREGPIESSPPENLQDLLSPDELANLVIDKTSHFFLDIQVDRGDGGAYKANEPIQVSVVMRDLKKEGLKSGYLYLFDIDPMGDMQLVFPKPGTPNRIEAEQVYRIPVEKADAPFVAQGQGQHDMKGIVTLRPIQLTGFAEVPSGQQQQQQTATAAEKPKDKKPKSSAAQTPQVQRRTAQRLVVHPRCQTRLRQRFASFRKGGPVEKVAPNKVGPFAQDMCSYRVAAAVPAQSDKKQISEKKDIPDKTQVLDKKKEPDQKQTTGQKQQPEKGRQASPEKND